MVTTCPGCLAYLKVPDGSVGRKARCPACQHRFIIPDPADANLQTIMGIVVRPPDAPPDAQLV